MRLSPALRKFVLTVHITLSVGWVGAVVAYLVLDLTVATSQDVPTLRAAYVAMDLITRSALLPLAVTAFATGVVISVGTSWGLVRHYWTLVSLLLTAVAVVVLVAEARVIAHLAAVAADPAASDAAVFALGNTLPHSIGGLAVLLVVLALNVYKPQGLTRYGWRKQRDERTLR